MIPKNLMRVGMLVDTIEIILTVLSTAAVLDETLAPACESEQIP